jgi:heme/copper-type cytochrome/quinol oxidase subunit 2
MIITVISICILIVAAIYGIPTYLFWRDIRRDNKKSKTIHQTENYWKYPIGQP